MRIDAELLVRQAEASAEASDSIFSGLVVPCAVSCLIAWLAVRYATWRLYSLNQPINHNNSID